MNKLLIVIDGLSKGGAERVSAWLANSFAGRSNYIVFLLVNFHQKNEYLTDKRIEKIYIDENIKENNFFNKVKFINCIIKEKEVDLVVSLGMPQLNCYVTLCCLKNRVRFILSERNDPRQYPSNKILRILRWINFFFANKLVFQTIGAQKYFSFLGRTKGVIIDNPLAETLPKPYIGKREKTIVNYCRLTSQKNLKLLIDSFEIVLKKHNDYKLLIYGEGEQRQELEDYIHSKKMNEYIIIYPFKKNIHKIILKATAFVSSSDYEGVSNSMLESMAIGLPCICTDCPPGGSREFITDRENGILVPVGNKDKLAEAICDVIDDENLQYKLSINAVKVRQRLRAEEIFYKWEYLISRLIK